MMTMRERREHLGTWLSCSQHKGMKQTLPVWQWRMCQQDTRKTKVWQSKTFKAVFPPITYLVVVVVGQTLTIKSHPPPLKNTFSAHKKEKQKCVWYTHKVINQKKKSSEIPKSQDSESVIRSVQVLIFHQECHCFINVKSCFNSCQLA